MKLTMGPEIRYGKALFNLSKQQSKKSISQEVVQISTLLSEDKQLQVVLSDELVSKQQKKNILLAVLKELKASSLLQDFASLMCDKGRAGLFAKALTCFQYFEMENKGVVVASVRTAHKLSAAQKKVIEKFVKDNAKNAKTVEMEEVLDPSLVAGLRVRIGSVEHDMSVRGRLDALRTTLN